MDSGNSGSMHSSSGGDEEYDSRPESAQAFLNPSGNYGSLSNPHTSLLSHHQNQQPNFFDPSSNYLHALTQSQPNSNPSSLLNLDLVRSRSLRSESNCTDSGNLQGSSSSNHSILATQGLNQGSFPSSSSMQSRLLHDNGTRSLPPTDQTNVVKNPKKRTRASRRAPTTVLTTDTSNFRAMVQEFTGIPAAPFSGSSYPRRFDLFGSGSAIKSGHMEPVEPLYPLRPTTQKFQPNPFVSSSSVVDAITASTSTIAGGSNNVNTITNSISAANNSTFNPPSVNNYPLLSDFGLNKEPQNMLNMHQNPVLSFQSLLQHPLNPSINVPGFGAKSEGGFGMPSFQELGMSHGQVNSSLGGLSTHVASGQDHMRSFDGNYGNSSSQRVTSCKLNYSASSSDFHHEKSLENVSSRGEGTVDSWICPSD